MAKKRESSEVEPTASPAISFMAEYSASEALTRDIDELCRKVNIDLSHKTIESPANLDKYSIKNQARKKYEVLWWTSKLALFEAKEDFIQALKDAPPGTYNTASQRTKLLYDKLRGPAEAATTPKSRKAARLANIHEPGGYDATQALPSSPKSPSFQRLAHASTNCSQPIAGPSTAPVSRLPFPKPTKSATDLRAAFTTIKPNTSVPSNAANTSFKSNTTATTSFNRSFQSLQSSQGFPATQDTPATSFSDDMAFEKRESDQFSPLTPSVVHDLVKRAEELEETLQPTQESTSIDETVRPPWTSHPDPATLPRESQSTCCGSPIATTDVDGPLESRKVEIFDSDSADDRQYSYTRPSPKSPKRVKPNHFEQDSAFQDKTVQGNVQNGTKANFRRRGIAQESVPAYTAPPTPELFQLDLSAALQRLPFEMQWEAQLVLQAGKLSAAELEAAWAPRTLEMLRQIAADDGMKASSKATKHDLKDHEVLTRNARLQWTKSKTGPSLDMVLQSPKKEKACALQRRLGDDRVLYVEIPDLAKPPDQFKKSDTLAHFQRWLDVPHYFLGREWYLFFLQPNKKKPAYSDKATGVGATDKSAAALHRLVLIAPPDHKSLCDILEWCLPYSTNSHQAARKAYMRLELMLSRTIVVEILRPEEFEIVPDMEATNDEDDDEFLDDDFADQFHEELDIETIMNDGCNRMKFWIAYRYKEILNLSTVPSTLQIRTAGAKGLWFIDSEDWRSIAERPSGVMLKLSKSQMKVFWESFDKCDDETRSVCVVKANPPAKPSILHMLFLPILRDRGVPESVLTEVVKTQVEADMKEFSEALDADDTLQLRRWISTHREHLETKNRETGIDKLAGFPLSSEEKIVQMLESGFHPKKYYHLAREVKKMGQRHFDLPRKNFKIRLPKSTTLMGIADPLGVLEPGEVCVVLSKPFSDPTTAESWWYLNNIQGLIARNPALARWDIQKVRFVFKPELAHLKDTIVFSTKGMRPLANKLQGGDYDGDTFWICWDERLVEPFKNAPAPWRPPPHNDFLIRKDPTKLSDHVKDPRSTDQWVKYLGAMAKKRMAANMLGTVTLFAERLAYAQGGIGSDEYIKLVHLHDYLVDSDKQGYDYDEDAFRAFRKQCKIGSDLPRPKYWKYSRNEDVEMKPKNGYQVTADVRKNIIDTVYIHIVQKIITKGLQEVALKIAEYDQYDSSLAKFYKETMEDASTSAEIATEREKLKEGLQDLRKEWATLFREKSTENAGDTSSKIPWPEAVQKVRSIYDKIQPQNIGSPVVTEWLRRQGHGLSTWDLLKASCFARWHGAYGNKPGTFIFAIAGSEMCYLKMNELEEGTRKMMVSQYQALKLRKIKKIDTKNDFDEHDEAAEDGEPEEALEAPAYF